MLLPGFVLLILAAMWAGVLYHIEQDRAAARKEALVLSQSLARTLADHANSILRQSDHATQLFKLKFEESDGAMRLAPFIRKNGLLDSVLPSKLDLPLALYGADGRLIDGVNGVFPPSAAGQDFFLQHAAERADSALFGTPVLQPASRKWQIRASRRLNDRAGRFAGVIALMIDPDYFIDEDRLDVQAGGAIMLISRDTGLLVGRVGQRLLAGEKIDFTLPAGAGPGADELLLRQRFDRTERIFSYSELPRYRLLAVVGLTEQVAMADVEQHRIMYIGAMLLASAVVIGFMTLLMRQARRLRASTRVAHEAQAMLRAAADASLDGVFLLKAWRRPEHNDIADFVYADVNQRGADMLGQPRERLLGRRMAEVAPLTQQPRFLGTYLQVLRSGRPVEDEFEVDPGDGTPVRWLHRQVVAIEDGVAITSRDITERKKDELELRNNRNFLQSLIDHLPLLIYVKSQRTDTLGQMVVWNRAAEAVTGYSAAQAIGPRRDGPGSAPFDALFGETEGQHAGDTSAEAGADPGAEAQTEAQADPQTGPAADPQTDPDTDPDTDDRDPAGAAAGAETAPPDPRHDLEPPEKPFLRPDGTVRYLRTISVPLFDQQRRPEYMLCIGEDVTGRRAQDQALRQNQAELAAINDASPHGLARGDGDGQCTYVNRTFEAITGLTREQALGQGWLKAVHPDDRDVMRRAMLHLKRTRQPFQSTLRCVHPDGKLTWLSLKIAAILIDGRIEGYVASLDDITTLRESEVALLESEARLRTIADTLPTMIAYVDAEQVYRFHNIAYEREFGTSLLQVHGKTVRATIGEARYAALRPYIARVLAGETLRFEEDDQYLGAPRSMEVNYIPQLGEDGAAVVGFHVMRQDITSEKHEKQRLLKLSQIDALTGLTNRAGFLLKLQESMQLCQQQGGLMAVMYMDIDHFKPVNDTHGHSVGDALLKAFSARLGHAMRASDTIARLGGDEFTIIMEQLTRREDAEARAAKIVAAMRLPFDLEGASVRVSASVGVAFYRDQALSPAALLKQADVLLYHAKQAGRDTFRAEGLPA